MRVATQRRSARQPPRGHPPPRRPVAAAAPAQPAASAAAPSPPPPPRRRPRPRAPSAVPAAPALRTLYPQPPLFSSLRLAVAPPHVLSVTQWGNPAGAPVLAVHGGPGAGSFPSHARFFDPQFYRVVLVDQRGCGSSAPAGLLAGQGCAPLVGDLEAVRRALGVDRWHVVFGGSWGVALSLAYAGAHPHRVGSLLLRSVCLMRAADIDWAYRRHGHAGTGAVLLIFFKSFFILNPDPMDHSRRPFLSGPLCGIFGRRGAAPLVGARPC